MPDTACQTRREWWWLRSGRQRPLPTSPYPKHSVVFASGPVSPVRSSANRGALGEYRSHGCSNPGGSSEELPARLLLSDMVRSASRINHSCETVSNSGLFVNHFVNY